MKYQYNNFVERRDLEKFIDWSLPVLEDSGVDSFLFYNELASNPMILDEAPALGSNNPNWWQRWMPSWLGGTSGTAAKDVWNRNKALGGQKDAMQKALQAYGGATVQDASGNTVPNPKLPDWLKQFAQDPTSYDKQALNFGQEYAKQNVVNTHGGTTPDAPAQQPTPQPQPQPQPQQPTPRPRRPIDSAALQRALQPFQQRMDSLEKAIASLTQQPQPQQPTQQPAPQTPTPTPPAPPVPKRPVKGKGRRP